VAVRLRPIEEAHRVRSRFIRHPERAWNCSPYAIEQIGAGRVDGKSYFQFDHIYGETSTTESIYHEIVTPVVQGVTSGKHGTVFCYGQTGSGKTFTMQGNEKNSQNESGILQMAVADVYHWIEESNEDSQIFISYFEIYNEQVRDLLPMMCEDDTIDSGSDHGTSLTVRSDPNEGVQVNCRQFQVNNLGRALELLSLGNRLRQVSATRMNQRSSRSHAIFRIKVEKRLGEKKIMACLNLVDLAGSENSSSADTNKLQQREGGTINKSLLSLSKVIHSLSLPPSTRPKFISYRDSKLTFILQPYLSGNALMAVICNINPSNAFVEETRSTLRFASRAKLIEIKAQVNVITTGDCEEVAKIKQELKATRQALLAMEQQNSKSENAYMEAASDLRKVKQLIFGGEDIRLTPKNSVLCHKFENGLLKTGTVPTITETRWSSDGGEHFDPNDTFWSSVSIPRITHRRDPASAQDAPPSEVLILTSNQEKGSWKSCVSDYEEKAKFLENCLENAEDMIDSLRIDLDNARTALRRIVHRNIILTGRLERYREKLEIAGSDTNGKLRAQYIILKWSIYLSFVFFFFRFQDLFLVTVMYVWLSLESFTA
jgi:centromeric protein E